MQTLRSISTGNILVPITAAKTLGHPFLDTLFQMYPKLFPHFKKQELSHGDYFVSLKKSPDPLLFIFLAIYPHYGYEVNYLDFAKILKRLQDSTSIEHVYTPWDFGKTDIIIPSCESERFLIKDILTNLFDVSYISI